MTLETERLRLRPWRETDAAALFEYAQDPLVGPAAGWPPHTSVENSLEIIRSVLSAENTFALVLKESGMPVGSCGIFPCNAPDAQGEPEIGYWIGRPLWGRGLVPEAVRALQRFTFETLDAPRVWCAHFRGNEKSRRVIEKCGFSYAFTYAADMRQLSEARESLFYSLSRADWSAQQK